MQKWAKKYKKSATKAFPVTFLAVRVKLTILKKAGPKTDRTDLSLKIDRIFGRRQPRPPRQIKRKPLNRRQSEPSRGTVQFFK